MANRKEEQQGAGTQKKWHSKDKAQHKLSQPSCQCSVCCLLFESTIKGIKHGAHKEQRKYRGQRVP